MLPALKAGLPQAFVQALAQRPPSDLRVKLPRYSAVPVPLEGGVRSPARREQV